MYSVKITKEANDDLEKTVTYITDVLKNPSAATNLLNEVENSFKNLSQSPEMYPCCNDNRLQKSGYRKIIVKNYIVFYKIDFTQETVYIMRVIYGRRDYGNLI